MLKSSVIA